MATGKLYDPVVSIEGMYHGSVTRIAYALKDPSNFGQSTRGIIQECSKQYQDALDDCEIQILDAKWYLEHQLRLRKQEREAKSREEQAASAKRKHSEVEEADDKQQEAKRVKVDEAAKDDSNSNALPSTEKKASLRTPSPKQPTNTAKPKTPSPQQAKPPKPATPPAKPPETLEDLQTSTRPTPTGEADTAPATADPDDPFNFTSMFGDPTDGEPGMLNPSGDLDFDLGLSMDNDTFATDANTQDPQQNVDSSDLNALLPELDSYAGQDTNNQQLPDLNAGASAAMDFGLPELGGPNEFDAMFDDANYDGAMMEGDLNLDLNLDLDGF